MRDLSQYQVALKVILTAPAKGDIRNIVFGVNDGAKDSDKLYPASYN